MTPESNLQSEDLSFLIGLLSCHSGSPREKAVTKQDLSNILGVDPDGFGFFLGSSNPFTVKSTDYSSMIFGCVRCFSLNRQRRLRFSTANQMWPSGLASRWIRAMVKNWLVVAINHATKNSSTISTAAAVVSRSVCLHSGIDADKHFPKS